jgi:hypothetical protein
MVDTTSTAPGRQNFAIATSTVVLSVTAIAVFLRLYTRFTLVKTVGIDDWAVAVAYTFTLACGISVAVGKYMRLRCGLLAPQWRRHADEELKTLDMAWVGMFGHCSQMTSSISRECVPPQPRHSRAPQLR